MSSASDRKSGCAVHALTAGSGQDGSAIIAVQPTESRLSAGVMVRIHLCAVSATTSTGLVTSAVALLGVSLTHGAPPTPICSSEQRLATLATVLKMLWVACMQSTISSVSIHASAHRHASVRKDRRNRKACP